MYNTMKLVLTEQIIRLKQMNRYFNVFRLAYNKLFSFWTWTVMFSSSGVKTKNNHKVKPRKKSEDLNYTTDRSKLENLTLILLFLRKNNYVCMFVKT